VLVVDHEFSPDRSDIELLTFLAEVGMEAHTPVLASTQLSFVPAGTAGPRDPDEACTEFYQGDQFVHWRKLRRKPAGRNLYLVIPRVYLCGSDAQPAKQHPQDIPEDMLSEQHLGMSPAYCVASRLAIAHGLYGWSATFSPERHRELGLMAGSDDESVRLPPLRWAAALANSGFLPIVGRRGSSFAAIFTCRSVAQTSAVTLDEHVLHDQQLLDVSVLCRIMHYIQAILRESNAVAGSGPQAIHDLVSGWLMGCCPSANSSDELVPLISANAVLKTHATGDFTIYLEVVPNLIGVKKRNQPLHGEIRFRREERFRGAAVPGEGPKFDV
jgi:predicted component of type VI protein secretion system